MPTLAVEFLDAALARSPAQVIFRRATRRDLVVLAYHDIRNERRFREQMEFIARSRGVISADDLAVSLRNDTALPPRSVLITFDDGDRTVYEVGLPILTTLGIPAVIFPVAGLIDTDEPFWWTEIEERVRRGARVPGLDAETPAEIIRWVKSVPDEVREETLETLRAADRTEVRASQLTSDEVLSIHRMGFEIGNHTYRHPCLNRCDPGRIEREIVAAHRFFADIVGRAPRYFAYPLGFRDPTVPPILEKLGYTAGFLFDHRLSAARPPDPLAISRVRVNSTTSIDRFQTILSGLHPFIHRLRGLP